MLTTLSTNMKRVNLTCCPEQIAACFFPAELAYVISATLRRLSVEDLSNAASG